MIGSCHPGNGKLNRLYRRSVPVIQAASVPVGKAQLRFSLDHGEELLLLLLLLLCLLHALKSHENGLGENGLLLLLLPHALQSQGNWLGQSGLLLLLLLHMLLHMLLQHGKQAWECGKDVRGCVSPSS